MPESLVNRTFRLLDKTNPSAAPFHAIVIGDDEKGVTYVEHGKVSHTVPQATFLEMVEAETGHAKPHHPLKVAEVQAAKPGKK